MENLRFTDKAPIGVVRDTQDGYVTTLARAVRTGVQEYAGYEVGLVDVDVVRVYRPPSEVFSADSLGTFSHAPVTMDHPNEMVTADNWKDLAVGEVSTEALRDGEFIALPLILKDADAIAKVKDGKVELSAGYTAMLDFTAGVTPDGDAYDAKQTNIVINHFGNGDIMITKQGNIKIGNITMQRKGGDGGRETAKMLQFKINPAELFEIK